MLAVIYRSYVKKELEDIYQSSWEIIAKYFIKERGAIGSCLHRTDDGCWLAYSRWPNKEVREKSKIYELLNNPTIPANVRNAIKTIKECKDHNKEEFKEICMTSISDFLC